MPQTGYSVTNTFATQSGNVPASQLDTNFTQPATALNALATYGNYYADTGSANTIVVTVPSPLVATYGTGLPLQILVAVNNTGATTINVNGLGAEALKYQDGSAMVSGQLTAGGIINVMYDGTNFQLLSTGAPGVTSVIAGTGISVSAATGNVTITNTAGAGSSGTFTGTLSGMTATTTGTFNYVSATNGLVTIYAKASITGTSNSASMVLSGVPAGLTPGSNVSCVTSNIYNAGVVATMGVANYGGFPGQFDLGVATVSGTTIVLDVANFATSLTKGVGTGFQFSYPLI